MQGPFDDEFSGGDGIANFSSTEELMHQYQTPNQQQQHRPPPSSVDTDAAGGLYGRDAFHDGDSAMDL